MSFNGSASRNPDAGDRLTYVWDFGDGSPATTTAGSRITHEYVQGATYIAQLVVRDNHANATLPASALTFIVLLHHDTHNHPYLGPVTGNTSQFNEPAPEDLGATTNS